jgi:hypothetical protein
MDLAQFDRLPPRNPAPLYGTPRSGRETIGGQVAKVLARSGSPGNTLSKALLPVMPWQRDALDVFCEIDPFTGMFWYRTCILVVVRQTGKTTLTRGKINHRALARPHSRILYTAQDRSMARKRLEKTIYDPLKASSLGNVLSKPRWAAGSEAVRWKNGSEVGTVALSETAAHGDTLDEAHIDEAFAHRDNRIEQAARPAMSTVEGAQMFISSAAGDRNSTYLWRQVEAGRLLVKEAVTESRTAYIEYSAPETADPDDPDTLLNTHPGVNHPGLARFSTLWDDRRTMDAEEFNRAYFGWWPSTDGPPPIIPLNLWAQNYVPDDDEGWIGEPMWAVDVSPDRAWASIAWAGRSTDLSAKSFVEVLEHGLGTAWVVARLKSLALEFGGWKVALDGSGSAGSLEDDLIAEGFEVERLTAHDRVAACGGLYDDVIHSRIRYFDDPVLTGAMKSAIKIHVYGGEAWIFSRGKSLKDITPLYAATFARFVYNKYAPATLNILETLG